MNIKKTPISGLLVVESKPHQDLRGSFTRMYCEKELNTLIKHRRVLQINHSHTINKGAVRGLHFQRHPFEEMKLVRCLKGKVWDVAIDLRNNSPTFLKWHAEVLTPANARMMVIPEGFAHGFQVMEPESELLYLHTAFYAPNTEGGLRCDDPMLGILWPLAITDLSDRDSSHPLIDLNFQGLSV